VNIFFFNKYLAYLKFQCFTWTESTCDQVRDIQASQIGFHKFIHSTKWPKTQKQNLKKHRKKIHTEPQSLPQTITFNIQLSISHQNYCYFTYFFWEHHFVYQKCFLLVLWPVAFLHFESASMWSLLWFWLSFPR
jgi:hypothetical protein